MFGGGGGGDPFRNPFEQMHRQMRQMDHLMNAMIGDAFDMLNSFGMGMPPRHPMLTDDHFDHNHQQQVQPRHRQQQQRFHDDMMMGMGPFRGFGFGGNLLGGMMSQMHNMHDRAMHDPDSVVISESTMMSFDGSGQPKVVQSSTRKVGNVKETRKAFRDGEREELSVGHHIGDKTHIVEKKRDKDGRIRQQQKFVNLRENEAREFNERFKHQARDNLGGLAGLFGGGHNPRDHRAIESGRNGYGPNGRGYHHHRTGETSTPIITIPDDEDEEEEAVPRHARNGRSRHGGTRYNDGGVIYSNNGTGPTIQEIDDTNETDTANPKRRKGVFKFMG